MDNTPTSPAPNAAPVTPWLIAYYRRRLADPTLDPGDRENMRIALAAAEARLAGRAS